VERPILKDFAEAKKNSSVKIRELEYAHFSNFINAVRSRRWQDLNADILEGHMSTGIIHLGNIAYRTERKLAFNPTSERFIGEFADDGNAFMTREYRSPYMVPDEV